MAGCKAGSRVQCKSAVEGGGGGGIDVYKFKKPSFIYNNCCPPCICGGFYSTPSLHFSRMELPESSHPMPLPWLSPSLTIESLKDQNMALMEQWIQNLLDPNCREAAMLELSKDDDVEAINFLLFVEMVLVCLRIMESGSELSKKVAAFIVHKILLNEVGIGYMCATPERLLAVCHVLNRMVQSLARKPSQCLLKRIIHCYLRLSEYTRARGSLGKCFLKCSWIQASVTVLTMMLQQNSVCSNCYIWCKPNGSSQPRLYAVDCQY